MIFMTDGCGNFGDPGKRVLKDISKKHPLGLLFAVGYGSNINDKEMMQIVKAGNKDVDN